MALSGAERQRRFRARREARLLDRAPPGEPPGGTLRAALVAYYVAETATPPESGDPTPEETTDQILAQFQTALFTVMLVNGLTGADEQAPVEAARLRVLAVINAFVPVPTPEEEAASAKARTELGRQRRRTALAANLPGVT